MCFLSAACLSLHYSAPSRILRRHNRIQFTEGGRWQPATCLDSKTVVRKAEIVRILISLNFLLPPPPLPATVPRMRFPPRSSSSSSTPPSQITAVQPVESLCSCSPPGRIGRRGFIATGNIISNIYIAGGITCVTSTAWHTSCRATGQPAGQLPAPHSAAGPQHSRVSMLYFRLFPIFSHNTIFCYNNHHYECVASTFE